MTKKYSDADHHSATASVSVALMPLLKWTRYPQTINAEYYVAIGEICARWSWLEFQAGVIVREALRLTKPAGFAITGGMSMRSVSTVLVSLALGDFPKGYPALA